mmetsp:Transcript_16782/g.28493  ORF Transcript_16782/g.28493 Transcript_16782/m.28493 type:complete len:86 (-) Transcript_16782:264-521(-)
MRVNHNQKTKNKLSMLNNRESAHALAESQEEDGLVLLDPHHSLLAQQNTSKPREPVKISNHCILLAQSLVSALASLAAKRGSCDP